MYGYWTSNLIGPLLDLKNYSLTRLEHHFFEHRTDSNLFMFFLMNGRTSNIVLDQVEHWLDMSLLSTLLSNAVGELLVISILRTSSFFKAGNDLASSNRAKKGEASWPTIGQLRVIFPLRISHCESNKNSHSFHWSATVLQQQLALLRSCQPLNQSSHTSLQNVAHVWVTYFIDLKWPTYLKWCQNPLSLILVIGITMFEVWCSIVRRQE